MVAAVLLQLFVSVRKLNIRHISLQHASLGIKAIFCPKSKSYMYMNFKQILIHRSLVLFSSSVRATAHLYMCRVGQQYDS